MTDSPRPPATTLREELSRLCERFGLEALYAFGSRAREVSDWVGGGAALAPGPSDVDSDVDIGAKPGREPFPLEAQVRLAVALEDLFAVKRVDVVSLEDADPFLAANIIRGERLHARDEYLADDYDLYVLRRAGDLARYERERLDAILEGRDR